jgi:hypothetical protein
LYFLKSVRIAVSVRILDLHFLKSVRIADSDRILDLYFLKSVRIADSVRILDLYFLKSVRIADSDIILDLSGDRRFTTVSLALVKVTSQMLKTPSNTLVLFTWFEQ